MIVYVTGEKAQKQASYLLSICPARHLEGQEVPTEWVNDKNEPIEINVEFVEGRAEVPDNIGRYLVKHEMATISRLIRPLQQLFTPGRPEPALPQTSCGTPDAYGWSCCGFPDACRRIPQS